MNLAWWALPAGSLVFAALVFLCVKMLDAVFPAPGKLARRRALSKIREMQEEDQ